MLNSHVICIREFHVSDLYFSYIKDYATVLFSYILIYGLLLVNTPNVLHYDKLTCLTIKKPSSNLSRISI